jgi:hypothetical protein
MHRKRARMQIRSQQGSLQAGCARPRPRELTRAPTPAQGIEGVRSFFERSEYALLLTDEYLLALPDDDDGPTPTT